MANALTTGMGDVGDEENEVYEESKQLTIQVISCWPLCVQCARR